MSELERKNVPQCPFPQILVASFTLPQLPKPCEMFCLLYINLPYIMALN